MTSQPRTRNNYTVGWVCALPKEQTAAIAMLDQEHADLPKLSDDPNTYTLGSIGDHNIVITCLPIGKIGTVSAATVATHMVHAFPSVKFGLMVGIGGGIPPKVRLGDVVVGIPMGQYPGVIQWDLGKEEKGGEFTRTGSLNKPPDSLLGAVSKLRSKNELEGSKIPYYLTAMSSKYPNLAPKYLRSETLQDMLFKAGYEHNESAPDTADRSVPEDEDEDENKDEEEEEEKEEESCRYCNKTQVVRRKPRDMRVHYGLITSGNRVVKNATFRDNLRRDLGKDVLCIEMEAAGLMDNFPCLVIRGICDYADSHKNKAWQEHAAAVAAAFAKELLGYIQRSDVDRERTVKDALNHISGTLSAIDENVTRTRHYLKKEKDVEILDWLTATDYGPQQSDYLKRRQPGTGQWLIDSGEYQNWIKESNKTLFCPGIPGAGKTILTSIVIDDLEKRLHREITSAVAYIYCNYKRRSEQTPESLLSSLLKQLGQTQPSLPHSLKELYDRHKAKRTRPSLDEIFKVLELVTVQNSRVFIIVDALDECQALDRCRTKFLSAIFNLQIKTRVNILTTSRFIPEITDQFKGAISIEIRATKDDISRYLRDRLPELPKLVTNQSSLQDEITTSITEAVDGMFLLARLHFDSLSDKYTINEIRGALKELKTGSDPYDTAYSKAMERIEGQLTRQAKRAKQVLSWITCAERQLTKLELQHALGVKIDEPELDENNLPCVEELVSLCAGLVTIDEESSIIRLVHYTTQDYFTQTRSKWFPDAQLSITAVCTTYLSYRNFASGYSKTNKEFKERLSLYPFYDYAAHNWGHHSREISVHQTIISFLWKSAEVEALSQALLVDEYRYYKDYSQRTPKQITGLHLASYFGLDEVVAILLGDCNADVRDSYSCTPLWMAAQKGHTAVVQQLLQTGKVDPDSKDEDYGYTPLMLAVEHRHEAVVQLLLATGKVNPDSKDTDGRTPLLLAVENEHEAIVQLLLTMGKADPNLRDPKGFTPLWRATKKGHAALIRLLLATK